LTSGLIRPSCGAPFTPPGAAAIPTALPLTYLEAGDAAGGVPLIVLHGLFGSARNWATLARRFGERRHVYALDLRNHGSSPWSAEMDYPAMAADLRRFLDDRGYRQAALVGHSMGGKAAMTFALTWPEAVERLVIADIAPVAYTHSFLAYTEAMRAVDLHPGVRRADIDAALAPAIPQPSLRSFLMQNLVADNGGFRWRLNLEAIAAADPAITGFPDLGPARCPKPALFIAGERSDYVPAAYHPPILARFPDARFETVAGAGHWLHAEKPDAFATLVESFL
jgi:esterase